MIACERVRPYLTSYGADELSPATTAWVRSHLRDCPECSATTSRFTHVSTAVRSLPQDSFEPPPGFTAGVMASVAERESHASRRLLPIPPVSPEHLGRIPSEIARVVSENRDAIMSGAATAAVAAGAAWLAWRAVKSTRRPNPA